MWPPPSARSNRLLPCRNQSVLKPATASNGCWRSNRFSSFALLSPSAGRGFPFSSNLPRRPSVMKITLSTAGLNRTPFLVIGSGIAGLYTALKLADIAPVTLITKETLEESNTSYAQGGIAAALSPDDSPDLHYTDTIQAGAGLCLPPAVTALVNEGPERVRELIAWGVPFDTEAGTLVMTREAAHSFSRVLHADGDATGREIIKVLVQRVRTHPRIPVKENHYAVALLTGEDGCYGALVLDENATQTSFLAEATVLATGGCGQIFTATTNPAVATGDGLALAF